MTETVAVNRTVSCRVAQPLGSNAERVMTMTDAELELKIEGLKKIIRQWAEKRDLWHDACFRTWTEHFNDEPEENPCVLVLCFDGELCNALNGYAEPGLQDEFIDIIARTEFLCELYDHTTVVFYADGEPLKTHFRDYVEWK